MKSRQGAILQNFMTFFIQLNQSASNMKLKIFLTLISYIAISLNINVLFYRKSHLYVVKLKQEVMEEVPEYFYIESWSVFDTFVQLNNDGIGTPSELRKRILDSISLVAFLIKSTCNAWKELSIDKYKSCDFSASCDLLESFNKILLNETAREMYMTEIQDVFDKHFDYWDVFVLATKSDQLLLSETFAHLKDKLQGDRFEKLPISTNESEFNREIKKVFNLFLDLTEAYYDCRQRFPDLKDFRMQLTLVAQDAHTKKELARHDTNSEGYKIAGSIQRLLNHLYLHLCLNHHEMIYINSIVAVFSAFWVGQIVIVLIFYIFPTLPFGVALTLEVIHHFVYRKMFGCACTIKKKLSILKVLAPTRKQLIIPKIPKFDNMRMYKRRKKKITK